MRNLAESVRPINEVMEKLDTPYAVVGGVVSSFLTDGEVNVDKEHRVLEVDPELFINPYRANGTLRDLDVVALTEDAKAVAIMSEYLYDNVDVPSISVTGYISKHEPSSSSLELVSRFLARDDAKLVVKLGKVAATIPRQDFEETWTLRRGEDEIQVLHPMAHMLSYSTRSIGGVRRRDELKIKSLEGFIRANFTIEDLSAYQNWADFPAALKRYVSVSEVLRRPTPTHIKTALAHRAVRLIENSYGLTKQMQNSGSPISRIAMRLLDHSGTGNMKTTA